MEESLQDLKIKFTTALNIQEIILLVDKSSLISKTRAHDSNTRRYPVPENSTANFEKKRSYWVEQNSSIFWLLVGNTKTQRLKTWLAKKPSLTDLNVLRILKT